MKENPMRRITISDLESLAQLLAEEGCQHYVYILRRPDEVECYGGVGTPFYVGIGQGRRLFAHEEEALDPTHIGLKVETIRAIWAIGKQVIRTIDSMHISEPWAREEDLINAIGRLADGRGPLTNAQSYSPSAILNGVELRKYAGEHLVVGDPNAIPTKFRLRHVRLMAGPIEPKSHTSVFGKIYTTLELNPGVTGEELVKILQKIDFSGNKTVYSQGSNVCAAWLVDYIEGGYFRNDRKHIQKYRT